MVERVLKFQPELVVILSNLCNERKKKSDKVSLHLK